MVPTRFAFTGRPSLLALTKFKFELICASGALEVSLMIAVVVVTAVLFFVSIMIMYLSPTSRFCLSGVRVFAFVVGAPTNL